MNTEYIKLRKKKKEFYDILFAEKCDLNLLIKNIKKTVGFLHYEFGFSYHHHADEKIFKNDYYIYENYTKPIKQIPSQFNITYEEAIKRVNALNHLKIKNLKIEAYFEYDNEYDVHYDINIFIYNKLCPSFIRKKILYIQDEIAFRNLKRSLG